MFDHFVMMTGLKTLAKSSYYSARERKTVGVVLACGLFDTVFCLYVRMCICMHFLWLAFKLVSLHKVEMCGLQFVLTV